MRRFAIAPERVVDGRVTFDAPETRHLARVLRLGPGDTVVASDGAGRDYTVRLTSVRPQATGIVVGVADAAGESPLAITLVQGVAKGDKLETIVRAATELGVTRVVPALTARSVVRLAERQGAARQARWQRVAREAAKQCGRPVVPDVAEARALEACLDEGRKADLALCLWEGGAPPLAAALAEATRPRHVAVLIGPEGGLEPREVEAARGRGWRVVGLGARILRTETAGPAMIAILQSRWGDLGTQEMGGPEMAPQTPQRSSRPE
jgi:16S rRNA (uracil1498-N3)-methyltransferase